MKRLLRWAMNSAGALSAVMFATACALWVRSYFVDDQLDWDSASGRAGLFSLHGRLGAGAVSVAPADRARILRGVSYRAPAAGPAASTALKPNWTSWTGFQAARISQPGIRAWDVRTPYWSLLLLTAPLPTLRAMAWRASRRRRAEGRCLRCGYNLRATPSVGGPLLSRCPECGTAAPNSIEPSPAGGD